MAQHKSATEVTVAPLEELSGFVSFVRRWWIFGAAGFIALAGAVLWLQQTEASKQATMNEGWDNLRELVQVESTTFGFPEVRLADPAKIESFASAAGSSGSGAWATALLAPAYFDAGKPSDALAAAREFQQQFSTHPLASRDADGGTAGTPLIDELAARLEGLAALRERLPMLSGNREPSADAPRVALQTTAGVIEVALYDDVAPKHVENFLELAANGTYVGTKFHRISPLFMIQGGDQNSIEGDPSTWGSGDAGYTIEQEFGDINHFPGVLAMAKRPDQSDSSGHQFYITVAPAHHLDGVHTVFGTVVSGMDIVEAIANGPIAEGYTDQAAEPATIEGIQVL